MKRNFIIFLFIIQTNYSFNQTYSDSFFKIEKIIILGNKQTKENIILRDLEFKTNDTIKINNWAKIKEKSRLNLLNLFLFNEVEINRNEDNSITIKVIERWYIWPIPVVKLADRNFNQWWLTKDPKRLIYGIELKHNNIAGKQHQLYLYALGGYTKQFDVLYKIPYWNKALNWGTHISFGINSNKEIWHKTIGNKVTFFRDNDKEIIQRYYANIKIIKRTGINQYHQYYLNYKNIKVADTVLNYAVNNHYLLDSNSNQQFELGIGYQYTLDKRDFRGFPLSGYYFRINSYLPYFSNQKLALKIENIATYFKPISKKIFGSIGFYGRYYSLKYMPYSLAQTLGYAREIIRAYELNVIEGQNYVLFKQEIKYRFFHKKVKVKEIIKPYNQIPIDIYLSFFSDQGYVETNSLHLSKENSYNNSWQIGYGLGINTIAFYDYCLRIEYSVNKHLFHRAYLSFIAPI